MLTFIKETFQKTEGAPLTVRIIWMAVLACALYFYAALAAWVAFTVIKIIILLLTGIIGWRQEITQNDSKLWQSNTHTKATIYWPL